LTFETHAAQLAEQAKGGPSVSLSEEAVVVCQRGAKIATTNGAVLDDVGADWENEKLSMISTFYRVQGKGFREKKAKFVLRSIRTSEDKRSDVGVALASGSMDLAQEVGADLETKRQVALELKSKMAGQKKAHFGTLHLAVCCMWLKDAK
jgi:hypothetical protein